MLPIVIWIVVGSAFGSLASLAMLADAQRGIVLSGVDASLIVSLLGVIVFLAVFNFIRRGAVRFLAPV